MNQQELTFGQKISVIPLLVIALIFAVIINSREWLLTKWRFLNDRCLFCGGRIKVEDYKHAYCIECGKDN